MRLSKMLWVTLREDPTEAEIKSHKLLLRAGYIRRITSGVYAYMPLMWRVLQKISRIVREEMDAAGAQECLLPQIQPAELWQESGRWETYTKAEGIMFSLTDRTNRELGLGPTHEEVITAIARETIRSYRQLPLNLYQLQTKFRDEIRPRFGLMRGREFIMKDAYSFHSSEVSLKETYRAMDQAYRNIFNRCGLKFRAVDADSGAIGGSGSQEFMVLAEAGEDDVLFTEDGKYAANMEKAISLPADLVPSTFTEYQKLLTPNTETIAKLAEVLKCSATQILKNVLYEVTYDSGITVLVLVSIRGDQEVNEVKLQNELVKLAGNYEGKALLALKVPDPESQKVWSSQSLPLGYIPPNLDDSYILDPRYISHDELEKLIPSTSYEYNKSIANHFYDPDKQGYDLVRMISRFEGNIINDSLNKEKTEEFPNRLKAFKDTRSKIKVHPQFLRLVDRTAVELKNFVTGGDEANYHVVGANWGKEFQLPKLIVDVRKAKAGDRSIHDPSQILQTARGIEVGHIFQLGTKYSKAMGATFTNENGEELPLIMGCYGLGVSRLAQAAVEQSHDKDGIIWNVAIAPYHVIISVPNVNDPAQIEVGEKLLRELNQAGIETILDDRDERAGLKFKDADLVGIPYRIVTGRSLAEGKVEVVNRATKEAKNIAIDQVVDTLSAIVFSTSRE
ncbi:prolyl-tRNA synthetase [Synechococcus sp. PCC 7502]|uniref:proline--tRNA ligase n=1 Tax=Synechococcus sp. PCC 7502 TaxID=1173263 RepID=UPI00029FA50C|nr:proline--tRNA ligase [Synechococcus sp. PCC 7502]AFY74015.1 prolyl-tRNA synthetase [Synechococcus sp. PCC 7502]